MDRSIHVNWEHNNQILCKKELIITIPKHAKLGKDAQFIG